MKKLILTVILSLTIISTAQADFTTYAFGLVTEINQYNVVVIQIGNDIFGLENKGIFEPGERVLVIFHNANRTYECNCGSGSDLMELTDMEVHKLP